LYLEADTGFGQVHTQDMHQAADLIEQGSWLPQEVLRAELPGRFGFVKKPGTL
jgi:hypothetical protein